jgi:cyclopropane-fatty-acyl-phospholipid synthase
MNAVADVTERIVFRALGRVCGGSIELRYPDGRGRRFGDGQGPAVVVSVVRPEAMWTAIGRRTRIGVGEAYVDGHWDCDDLVGLLSLLGRNVHVASAHGVVGAVQAVQRVRPDRAQKQSLRAARDNIHAHYDLGNDLFALMLGDTMTYSCAYWDRPDLNLDEAQTAKLRLVCAKLRLGPDDHLLEIGCGWGGLAVLAAEETGCRVLGPIPLGREQGARRGPS